MSRRVFRKASRGVSRFVVVVVGVVVGRREGRGEQPCDGFVGFTVMSWAQASSKAGITISSLAEI